MNERAMLRRDLKKRDRASAISLSYTEQRLIFYIAAQRDQNTFLIQSCGSFVRPYWMSTSFLRMPMATGPAAPPLIWKSPLVEQTLPIGEITAAVPQAKASFSLPLAASWRHCSMV